MKQRIKDDNDVDTASPSVATTLSPRNETANDLKSTHMPTLIDETPLICIELCQKLKEFDSDNDQYLTCKEFKHFLQSLNIPNSHVTLPLIEYFFSDFSTDQFSEFFFFLLFVSLRLSVIYLNI